MRAVVYEKYGPPDVLELRDVAKPVPKNDEVLVKVHATSVTAGDWRMRKAEPFLVRLFNGLLKPKRVKVLGFEVSGVIEGLGKDVQSFRSGDAVFAFCGYTFGGYAEYRCLSEEGVIAHKPEGMSFEQAATVPLGSLTALNFLKKGNIAKGQRVLIYGASGSVGSFAVQIARHFETHVTGVCSGKNKEMVRSLGADEVIDYTTTDIGTLPLKFDVIFDAVGKTSKSACKNLLASGGKYVTVNSPGKFDKEGLAFVKQLIDSGKLTTVIDRTYALDEIREAHRYVEKFHKRGNVAVLVSR
jgi:NADPH:quinone reductase-like Zn-dependent oxidoreductase